MRFFQHFSIVWVLSENRKPGYISKDLRLKFYVMQPTCFCFSYRHQSQYNTRDKWGKVIKQNERLWAQLQAYVNKMSQFLQKIYWMQKETADELEQKKKSHLNEMWEERKKWIKSNFKQQTD